MSEQTDGYDPEQDTDSDPGTLNPRSGASATSARDAGAQQDDARETGQDTDADPGNLNPRDDTSG